MGKLVVLSSMISVGITTLQLIIINTSRNMILLLVSMKFLYIILRVRMAREKDTIKNIHDKSAIRPIEAKYKKTNHLKNIRPMYIKNIIFGIRETKMAIKMSGAFFQHLPKWNRSAHIKIQYTLNNLIVIVTMIRLVPFTFKGKANTLTDGVAKKPLKQSR